MPGRWLRISVDIPPPAIAYPTPRASLPPVTERSAGETSLITNSPSKVLGTAATVTSLNTFTAVYQLTDRQIFVTSANGAIPDWDAYVITDSTFEDTGPAIVDMILHTEGENFAGNFQYRIRLEVKLQDGTWGNPPGGSLVIAGPYTSAVYQISAIFVDRTKLGIRSRLVLEVNNSGAATPVSGRLTIHAAVRYYCGC